VVALDEDLAGLEQLAGIDLEQAGGVENDGSGSRAWLRLFRLCLSGLCLRGNNACRDASSERADSEH
jgi:hypothetical protein